MHNSVKKDKQCTISLSKLYIKNYKSYYALKQKNAKQLKMESIV